MRRALVIGGGKPEPQFVGIGAGVVVSGSAVVTRPAVNAGDLMLAAISSSIAVSAPAGWTLLNTPTARLYVYGRIASAGEPSNYTWSNVVGNGFIAAYRGVQLAPNADGTNGVGTHSTSYTANSITPTVPSMLVYVMYTNSDGAVTGPSGMTAHPVAATNGSTIRNQLIAEQFNVPAAATGSRTGTGGSTVSFGAGAAALLAFTPA